MRVTGGRTKGRLLRSPKGLNIRPTTDKVREAVFSIIGQNLFGFHVLDLFAGTGSLGIEALSRGAEFAVLIDLSPYSIQLIRENLTLCGYQDLGTVLKRDLNKGLPLGHPMMQKGFDLVFMDPPYGKSLLSPMMRSVSRTGILSAKSIVVTELSKHETPPSDIGSLVLADTRTYGATKISFYSNEVVL